MYSPYGQQQGQQNPQGPAGGQPYGPQGGQPYQQNQTPGSHPPPGQSPYGGGQGGYFPPGTPGQEQGQWGQPASGAGTPGAVGGITAGMGAMNVGGGEIASHRAGKKKNRHAYHNLDQGIAEGQHPPAPGTGGSGPDPRFSNQQPGTPGLHGGPITPQMNQFPAQGGAFVPGSRPGTGVQHGQEPAGASTGVSTQGRVDPEQIPSIPRSRDGPEQYYLTNNYLTVEQHVPPPAAIPFTAYDQGNSSPKYARLTLNDIPASAEALAQTALPLGLVLQPLAPTAPGEYPIPVLDFGETGPPRCRRCRTYINPFMSFRSGGNKFVCNMCTFPNDVPPEYFAPTDMSGVRVDREQRPELKLGTVEFMVPKEYWAKEPVGLRHLFVIDVSREALHRGFLQAFCDGVLAALYPEPKDDQEKPEGEPAEERAIPEGSKVGFVTFDRDTHFYNCSPGLKEAQMLVMPDLEDPFVPLGSDGLFVDPYESRSVIEGLLKRLPTLFSNVQNPEPALLSALNAAVDSLSSTGGKIIASISSLPTLGPGKLHQRDDKNISGLETEKKLFQTENANWKKTADKMVEIGIGVDMFIAAPGGAYMDVAALGMYGSLASTNTADDIRSCFGKDGRRNILLLELCDASRQLARRTRRQTGHNKRDWVSGIDEGSMLERATSILVPRQLSATYLWS
jgi:protein transport protein SEC24